VTVSVFTPSHDPRWLDEARSSLLAQTHGDWEWIVLLNGGATWAPRSLDPRVKVHSTRRVTGIGDAKRRSVALTTGDILVELDHDDLLLPDALSSVAESFGRRPEQRFVYSDFAEMGPDGARRDGRFEADHGWRYSDFSMGDQVMDRCHAMVPSPRNVSLIWYAPNHVRAFTRGLYDEVGGYDRALQVLDDQDLMCRMYERTAFAHIDRCLYLQRRHPMNSQSDTSVNALIQEQTVAMANRWLERLALAWADREGLAAVDLCPDGAPGDRAVPRVPCPSRPGTGTLRIDADDSTVGVVRAVDVIQLFPDKIATLDEIYRVLAHGGLARIAQPSTDGRGAFQDPRHVSFWNENSFWYVTDRAYRRYVPEIRARFQVARLATAFPDDWCRRNDIPYVYADLIAVKDGPRQGGLLEV
jgi:O-antigen biosynthesis protein